MSAREQADAIALAVDSAVDSVPSDVVVHHRQIGTGTQTIEHRVEIRDNTSGALLANFPPAWAALWLKNRDYRYVVGTNGLWSRP